MNKKINNKKAAFSSRISAAAMQDHFAERSETRHFVTTQTTSVSPHKKQTKQTAAHHKRFFACPDIDADPTAGAGSDQCESTT
ncbi:hypothetical protein [Sphingobacterium thalpophilum]|uniref:hypothetical protein n=1 Tax=Sphingobacterium thalpophilum TaxID=259 RepID=UPI0031DAFCA8